MKRKTLIIITMLFILFFSSCKVVQTKKPVYDGQNLEKYHRQLQKHYESNKKETGKFVK
jgi:hypothetical protein